MQADKYTGIGKGRQGHLFDPVHRFSRGGRSGAGLLPTVTNTPIPCSRPLEV